MSTELLTIQEVAEVCKVSVRTVSRWLRDRLPAVRIGGVTRIRRSDLERFMEANLSRGSAGNGGRNVS